MASVSGSSRQMYPADDDAEREDPDGAITPELT
jgi:hypothetical protein